jgi:hypothetical protein
MRVHGPLRQNDTNGGCARTNQLNVLCSKRHMPQADNSPMQLSDIDVNSPLEESACPSVPSRCCGHTTPHLELSGQLSHDYDECS